MRKPSDYDDSENMRQASESIEGWLWYFCMTAVIAVLGLILLFMESGDYKSLIIMLITVATGLAIFLFIRKGKGMRPRQLRPRKAEDESDGGGTGRRIDNTEIRN